MPGSPRLIYWDGNVFLSYVNGVPDRLPTLDAILDQAEKRGIKIITSVLTKVEVAFAENVSEKAAHVAPHP